MHNFHRHATLEQWQCKTVEIAQLWAVVTLDRRRGALKHQRIGHQHGYTLTAAHAIWAHRHRVERIDHHLHLGGVESRNAYAIVACGALAIKAFVDTVGPRHHLIVVIVGVQKFCHKSGLIIALIVRPVHGAILYGVGKEVDAALGGRCHTLHAPIFEKCGLKHAFAATPVIVVGRARSAGPHLSNIAINHRQRSKTRLRAHYLPLRVVDERMRGHIASYVLAKAFAILLGVGKSLIECSIIEMILQLVGEICVGSAQVLRAPFEAVIFLPLALESIAIACPSPKFGFFEINRFDTGIYHAFYVAFLEILQKMARRHNVGNERAVPNGVAVDGLLPLIEVPTTIPLACEIVLIFAPGNAGHKMGDVAMIAPRLHSFFKSLATAALAGVAAHTIHYSHIGAAVGGRLPRLRGLKRREFSWLLFCFIIFAEKPHSAPHRDAYHDDSFKSYIHSPSKSIHLKFVDSSREAFALIGFGDVEAHIACFHRFG